MEEEFRKDLILIIRKKYLSAYISNEVGETFEMKLRETIDYFGKTLAIMFSVPEEPLKTVSEIAKCEVPKTWIDHLRNDHFPRFLIRKFPIKFKVIEIPVEIEVGAVYPKLKQTFKQDEQRIIYMPFLENYPFYSERKENEE